jgi:hypothetical protein
MYVGKRFSSLEDGEFNQLFLDFRYTCYRLETLQRYDVSYEREGYDRFLAGETQGESPALTNWIDGTIRPWQRASKCGECMWSKNRCRTTCAMSSAGRTSTP